MNLLVEPLLLLPKTDEVIASGEPRRIRLLPLRMGFVEAVNARDGALTLVLDGDCGLFRVEWGDGQGEELDRRHPVCDAGAMLPSKLLDAARVSYRYESDGSYQTEVFWKPLENLRAEPKPWVCIERFEVIAP